MRLIEVEAKQLLKQQGIAIPRGVFFPFDQPFPDSLLPWPDGCYVKAQVLEGRRGARGFIRLCRSGQEIHQAIIDMRSCLSPETCAGFLCEEVCEAAQEWFVACDLDPATGKIRFHADQQGGSRVERAETWFEDRMTPVFVPTSLRHLLEGCVRVLPMLDALSIEVNPFAQTPDGSFIALDAKIELDESAAFRHPEWNDLSSLSRWGVLRGPREKKYVSLLAAPNRSPSFAGRYRELEGDIALVLAGGGASLVALDALIEAGGTPGNYLELSGNPDPEFVRQAARLVFSRPTIRAVWIAGSHANFTDLQATLGAICSAMQEEGLRVPVFIRRDGPRREEAEKDAILWARAYGVSMVFRDASCSFLEAAEQVVAGLT